MARRNKNTVAAVFFIAWLAFILTIAGNAYATDETENRTEQLERKVESATKGALAEIKTASDLIELLKQRALLRVKKRKRERLLKVNVFSAANFGYENNVNNDASMKGDAFNNEFLMVSWVPTFNKYLGLNVSALSYNQSYSCLTDSNFLYNNFSSAIRIYPFSDGKLRFEPGVGYEILWYPRSSNSSYNNLKYFLKTRNFLSAELSIDLNFEASFKEYDTKKARNPSGITVASVREDERYEAEAAVEYRIGRYTIGIGEQLYKNSSNDLLQELNDYYSLKSALDISGSFFDDRLYLVFNPSIERKNYRVRLGVDTARFDDIYDWSFGAYYALSKNYTLTYKFDFWSVDSNNSLAEYENTINQIGISARF